MTLTCDSCGAEHAPDAQFCSACGASLRRVCPTCGHEESAEAAFCSACGTALRSGVGRAAAGVEHEERRVVTLLFADLAGSTQLVERLDPEDVRRLQGELFELVNDEVERYGGTTEKFAGDAVLAVFGAPLAHEDDPERALFAALAAQERFAEFAAAVRSRHGTDVALRVGINTGEVVAGREAAARGELMVSGDAVNVAARLQQHAEPGTVLVGARTRAASRRAIEYAASAPLDVKGKREPVEAWRAVRARAAAAPRGVEGLRAPLVGRDAELAVLALAAERVERERVPQLVTLYGPAGVGKSRLLAELAARLPQALLLEGRCLPYGDGITYWPLAEAVKAHAGIRETDSRTDAIAKLRAAVAEVVPEDADTLVESLGLTIGLVSGESESAAAGPRIRDAWTRYLEALGRVRPTVLVVEDIHWASQPLLDLVEHLADTLADTAVLIACPSRPELLETRPSWGAGKLNAIALTLSPLPPRHASELVERLLRVDEVPEAVQGHILDRAEGNPFYVEELLQMLIERGALVRRNGGWQATELLRDLPLPDTVHGVISARLDLVDGPAREALRQCSVVGRVFWPAAVGAPEDAIGSLVRRGLVSETAQSSMAGMREFAFKHALTRDVAYSTLPRPERRALHRRTADWIVEVAGGRTDEVAELAAYHLSEAIAYGEDDDAVVRRAHELLLEAGRVALGRAAVPTAARLLERALELAPDDEARAPALIELGRCAVTDGRLADALDLLGQALQLARELDDDVLQADVLGWETRARWLSGHWDEALAAVNDAVALLDGRPESPQLARVLARRSQIEMLRGLPQAAGHADEAVEVARRVGDVFAEVNAEINGFTARSLDGVAPSAADLNRLVRTSIAHGIPDEAYRAAANYIWSAGGFASVHELEEAVTKTRDVLPPGSPAEFYEEYVALSLAEGVYVPSGRWGEADAIAEEIATTCLAASASVQLVWSTVSSGLALRRGRLDAVDELLPTYRARALASEEPQRILPMIGVALPRAAVAGDRAGGRELAEIALAVPPNRYIPSLFSPAIPRALGALGDLEALRRLRGTLGQLPPARLESDLAILACVVDGLIELAEGAGAAALPHLRRAVDVANGRGRRYEAATIELEVARALGLAGDEPAAAEIRARTEAYLAALGCVNPY